MAKNIKDFQKSVDEYFLKCEENGKPVTRTGLAVFLGLTKDELTKLRCGEKDTKTQKYSEILRIADTKIEEYAESLLFTRDKGHTALMFYLKSNFGWNDKSGEETESGNISVKISIV